MNGLIKQVELQSGGSAIDVGLDIVSDLLNAGCMYR